MPLAAHLRGDRAVFARRFAQEAGFADVMADRFFAVNIFSGLHGHHGDFGVVMIGRGDKHRVNIFPNLVKHHAVIGEHLEFVRVAVVIFQPVFDAGVLSRIRVNDGVKVLAELVNHCVQVSRSANAAADLDAVELVQRAGGREKIRAGK